MKGQELGVNVRKIIAYIMVIVGITVGILLLTGWGQDVAVAVAEMMSGTIGSIWAALGVGA